MAVSFAGRPPRPDDAATVGLVDVRENDRWIPLGESRAWCWQQGCMLQWRPRSTDEVVWNDQFGGRLVCHVLNVETRTRRTLRWPIYALAPDGRWAVTLDFGRVNQLRPGYGYAGLTDPFAHIAAPEASGIWRVDLDTGARALLVSLADVAGMPWPHGEFGRAPHWFNHLLVSPDGTRVSFLHRWRVGTAGWKTRLMTAGACGGDIRVLDDCGEASHYIWRDPGHLLVWADRPPAGPGFYVLQDGAGSAHRVGEGAMEQNGHCSFLAGGEWIVNDTYPDPDRLQHLYLYHVPTHRRIELGAFHTPDEYRDEWRCDLHPRSSPDGRSIVIDSAHAGHGRQLYLLDVRGIVDGSN
jgi:hypothetical protein